MNEDNFSYGLKTMGEIVKRLETEINYGDGTEPDSKALADIAFKLVSITTGENKKAVGEIACYLQTLFMSRTRASEKFKEFNKDLSNWVILQKKIETERFEASLRNGEFVCRVVGSKFGKNYKHSLVGCTECPARRECEELTKKEKSQN